MDERQQRAVLRVMAGEDPSDVAAALGVDEAQVDRWLEDRPAPPQELSDWVREQIDREAPAREVIDLLGHEPIASVELPEDPDLEPNLLLVSFPDIVAHDLQRFVRATVEAVGTVAGVTRVWQEDRELILVEHDGVDRQALEASLREWLWAQIRSEMARDPG